MNYTLSFVAIGSWDQSSPAGEVVVTAECYNAFKALNKENHGYMSNLQDKVAQELFKINASAYSVRRGMFTPYKGHIYTLDELTPAIDRIKKKQADEKAKRDEYFKGRSPSLFDEMAYCIHSAFSDAVDEVASAFEPILPVIVPIMLAKEVLQRTTRMMAKTIKMTENIEYQGKLEKEPQNEQKPAIE